MEREEPHSRSGPVLVGGTGRCGTHVIAALVDRSGRYAAVPAELRLHASREGLAGFAAGDLSRRRLLEMLCTRWWRNRPPWDPSVARGAHRIAPRHRYFAAVARLAASSPGADRHALSCRFVRSLLDPLAPSPGAWVEKSPDNCAAAGFMHRLFPELRLIHVIRDGRDVACSFMCVPWAPDDFEAALDLWERRMLDAHLGTLQVPADHVHRVLLEDLVAFDRARSYRGLLAFLGIPDEPALRSFFDHELTAARAGISRWRADLPPAQHACADSLYRESLERLNAAGVAPLPRPDRTVHLDQPSVAGDTDTVSPIDPWAPTTAKGRGHPVPTF